MLYCIDQSTFYIIKNWLLLWCYPGLLMYFLGRVMILFSWIQPQVNINFLRSHSFVEIHRLLTQIYSVAKSLLWRLSKLSKNVKKYYIITFLDLWCLELYWLCKYFLLFVQMCTCVQSCVTMSVGIYGIKFTAMSP